MTKERLWLPALVLAATAYTGVGIQGPRETPSSTGPRPGRPECPHDWDFKAGQMAVVGPNINVPEFHDCQRFIVYRDTAVYGDTAAVYDSLYAIFAAAGLDTLDTTLARLDSTHSGTVALAAAEIYAEGVYLQLGIKEMFGCLYLYRDVVWRAKMVPVGTAEKDCGGHVNPAGLSGIVLEVHRDSTTRFGERDFPAVARWEWDFVHHWQIIGIKCGRAWCEIGPEGFRTPQPEFWALGANGKRARSRMVKGWYDDQFLATVTPNGDVRPSKLWGTIYPDSGLDDYDTLNTFRRGRWVHVADITLRDMSGASSPSNPYKSSLNIDLTVHGGRLNSIYLCRGTMGQCGAVPSRRCDGDGQWWARVTRAGDGARRDKCDMRRAHDGLGHVPGTARWRWLASDETTWQRCDNGCCELKA